MTKKQVTLLKIWVKNRGVKFNDVPVDKWEILEALNASELDWPHIKAAIETYKGIGDIRSKKNYKLTHENGHETYLMLTKPEADLLARIRTLLCFKKMEVVK